MSRIRGRFSALLLVGLLLNPSPGRAQNRESVVAQIIRLTNALGGAFGDEGADVTRALEDLESALAQWDVSIARAERGFAMDMPAAPRDVQADMLAAIGSLYVQRGRLDDSIRQLKASLALPGRSRATVAQLLAAAQRAAGHEADAADTLRAEWGRAQGDPALAVLVTEAGPVTAAQLDVALQAALDVMLVADDRPATPPFVSLAIVDSDSITQPIFAPARYADAYSRLLRGDFVGGVGAIREAVRLDPLVGGAATQPPSMWSGIAALRQGRIAEGIEKLRSSVATSPRSSEAHRSMGTAYWSDGRVSEAGAEFEEAITLNPADERAYLALADVFRESGDNLRMQQTLARAGGAIPQSGQLRWALGRAREQEHADSDAMTAYADALRTGAAVAGEGYIYGAIGRLHHAHLDLDAAAAAYERRVRVEPNRAAAHQALGEVLQARDLHARAVIEFLAAHLLNPRDASALAAAGQSLMALGRHGEAEQAARRALQIDADNVPARYTLAVVLPRLGRADEGQQQLTEFRQLQARLVAAQRRGMEMNGFKLQAQVLSRSGDHAGAASAWEQAIAIAGPEPETLVELARERAAAGQTDAAAAAYRDAVTRWPEPATQRELVTLLEKAGRTADAAAARALYERMKQERLQRLGGMR